MDSHVHSFPLRRVLAALGIASAIALALLIARVVISGKLSHAYLAPNLVLAWMPLLFAELAARRANCKRTLPILAGLWLLFFPNAPYIVTDLVHLRPRPPIPLWYDLLLLQLFIWIGLCLAFISLHRIQTLLTRAWNRTSSALFLIAIAGLTGFGIYLGRFERWNSWDLLVQPFDLLGGIARILLNPWAHKTAVIFSFVFGSFFLAAYLSMLAVMHLKVAPQKEHST